MGVCVATIGLYGQSRKTHGGAGLIAPWQEGGKDKYHNEPIIVIGGSSCVGYNGEWTERTLACDSS